MVIDVSTQALENRAVKHLVGQDSVLIRAVARVWKARERGRLLERVKASRTMKNAWAAWIQRLRGQMQREGFGPLYAYLG